MRCVRCGITNELWESVSADRSIVLLKLHLRHSGRTSPAVLCLQQGLALSGVRSACLQMPAEFTISNRNCSTRKSQQRMTGQSDTELSRLAWAAPQLNSILAKACCWPVWTRQQQDRQVGRRSSQWIFFSLSLASAPATTALEHEPLFLHNVMKQTQQKKQHPRFSFILHGFRFASFLWENWHPAK